MKVVKIVIKTIRIIENIQMSRDHYIETPSGMLPAGEMKVNDLIRTIYGYVSIIDVKDIICTGIVAPMTYSGKLIVNNVYVSCFTDVVSLWKCKLAIKIMYYPLRFTSLFSRCHNKDSNGIPTWVKFLIRISCNGKILERIQRRYDDNYQTF